MTDQPRADAILRAAVDVDLLAEAEWTVDQGNWFIEKSDAQEWAKEVAAEYARLLSALAPGGRDVSEHSILEDSIEGNLQRVDALRVLELACASQGYPEVNAPSLLRDIEEGGYTLRLTTSDERRLRRTTEDET